MPILEQSFAVVTVLLAGILVWIVQQTPERMKQTWIMLVAAYLVTLALLFFEKVLAPHRADTLQPARWGIWAMVVLGCIPAVFLLKDRRHLLAYLLAWVVPGLGHLYLGKRLKSLLFLAAIMGLHLIGLFLCGFRGVGADDNPYYYAGKFGSGLIMVCAWILGPDKPVPGGGISMLWFDPALLYGAVAGLLNLVAALNVFLVEVPELKRPEPIEPNQEPASP